MHKNKTIKRINKYSKKTRKRNICEKGVTSEVIRIRKLIKEVRAKNKKNFKKNESKKNEEAKE
jgi:hypothetical protein